MVIYNKEKIVVVCVCCTGMAHPRDHRIETYFRKLNCLQIQFGKKETSSIRQDIFSNSL